MFKPICKISEMIMYDSVSLARREQYVTRSLLYNYRSLLYSYI